MMMTPTMVTSSGQQLVGPDSEPNHARHASRDSGTFTNTKGLLNAPGQNNCFLNSAVQVLWHLDIFRRSFRELSGHACMGNACIFCALKELFSQLQFSRERALPADEVRRALAAPFCGQRRFRLGCMADAAECFENILLRLHAHAALPARPDDMCRAPHCLPHRKFAMALVEQGLCSACGATSEPLPFTQMVHYVSASALTTQARQNSGCLSTNGQSMENFGDLLKRAGGMGDVRDCPSACGAKTQICRSLMNKPEIVSVGVVWDSERPTLEHIMDVFGTIGTTLQLKDLFHSVVDQCWSTQTVHNLVGVVTYYGKHYSTFFFHTKLRLWIYFDDATVKEVGPRWEQVVEKCRKGRYQPLLLLYSTPNGTPCNTENAPKTIIPYPNLVQANPVQSALRRSVTPNPEKPANGNTRRAITPNPDNHIFTQSRPPVHRPYNEYQNLTVIQDNLYGKQSVDDIDMTDGSKDTEPEYISRKTVENVLNAQNAKKQQMQLHRSLSTGSTSNSGDVIVIPEHLNVPRRRDSGNWSGDRNSTSSSSSTTMENPYLYLVGKMQHRNGSLPSSPTRKGELSSGSSGRYDAGYDSYSLSSTDSLPLQQGLKHNLQLAQIPEYQPHIKGFGKPLLSQDDCGRLCMEADQLLDKSRQIEDTNDLETALVLCNAAASKARAAMDAPYNNPHMMTFARMKHNTCIMRARSLHRRILQEQGFCEKDSVNPDIRHTREGSNSSARHSRQNSREKSSHSRQNSKEMLAPVPVPVIEKVSPSNKNIEIYATLPKKKSTLKKSPQSNAIEDEEYMIYDRPSRESRSIFGRSKNKDEDKGKEKRSRSEDRSKALKEMSIAPDSLSNAKDTLKRDKAKEEKEDKKGDKDGKPGKKQHKIRRKLLMGGLIRRKNRSMPDLTEGNADDNNKSIEIKPLSSVDDSGVGLKGMDKNLSGMSGYLSEGHLEYSGNGSTNPNLERSKLMRKSFHGSAGKILTIAKVPPPPPLRTTSQLSGPKQSDEIDHIDSASSNCRPQYPLPPEIQNVNYFPSNYNYNQDKTKHSLDNIISSFDHEPQSLPFLPSYNDNVANKNYNHNQRLKDINQCFNQGMVYDTCNTPLVNGFQTVITKADVHQEKSPIKQDPINMYPVLHTIQNKPHPVDDGIDEVDCIGIRMNNLELPPYPSPPNSVLHSRQASEDFPPPPPPLENGVQDEIKSELIDMGQNNNAFEEPPTGLLAQLQQKRQQILASESVSKKTVAEESPRSTGETWLKELQAKQAALKLKKSTNINEGASRLNIQQINNIKRNQSLFTELVNNISSEVENSNLVKNLASKFEYGKPSHGGNEVNQNSKTPIYNGIGDLKPTNTNYSTNVDTLNTYISENYNGARRISESSIDKQQIEEELREVEMVNAAVTRQLSQHLVHSSTDTLNSIIESKVDNILRAKKKSVSFCDQVILVATAEDQDDDSYIPNPILERVLKSNLNKSDTTLQPLQGEKPSLKRQDSIESQKSTVSTVSHNSLASVENNIQPEYVKIPSAYQPLPGSDLIKPNDNSLNQQARLAMNSPYHQISANNIQTNTSQSGIYQSPPVSSQINNIINAQRPLVKAAPVSSNQIYQTHSGYPNNYQNQQYPIQNTQSYNQNTQYAPQQNVNLQKQPINTYSMANNLTQPPLNYQQKQNSMYFPVNRTQPAYQNNNNSQPSSSYPGTNLQPSQYPTSNSYQNNSNSPYQHLPTATAQYHQTYDSNTVNSSYETDRSNISKYSNNVPNLLKNEQLMASSPSYNNQQTPMMSSYNPINTYSAQNGNQQNLSPPSYNVGANNNTQYNSPYQRVPQVNVDSHMNHLNSNSSVYQRLSQNCNTDAQSVSSQNGQYQKLPQASNNPQYNMQADTRQYNYQQGYNGEMQNSSPYQSVPTSHLAYTAAMSKQPQKKSVSFEPGTKGGCESPIPKQVVVGSPNLTNGNLNQYVINNNHVNNSVNSVNSINMNSQLGKAPCNLCRKKIVNSPSIYCIDCDFYMSRFKPRA